MSKLFEEVKSLATEQRNPDSSNMDEMTTEEILRLINREDAKVAEAVREEILHVTTVVDELVRRFRNGGRLFYAGAGTSGIMAAFTRSGFAFGGSGIAASATGGLGAGAVATTGGGSTASNTTGHRA